MSDCSLSYSYVLDLRSRQGNHKVLPWHLKIKCDASGGINSSGQGRNLLPVDRIIKQDQILRI